MSYDAFLPTLDLARFADEARKAAGYKMFYAGGRVLFLGLLVKSAINLVRIARNQAADLLSPILSAAFFFALLSFYKEFVNNTIYIVSHLGNIADEADNVATAFVVRHETYLQWQIAHGSYKTWFLEELVGILYLLVEAVVVFFRAGQKGVLSILIVYGPLVLGAASLGGFFTPLALGWFWGLVEVSAWSVTMDIILFGYSKANLATTVEQISIQQEFIVGAVMFFLLLAIPAVTSFVLRGTAGASMAAAHRSTLGMATTLVSSKASQRINTAMYDGAKSAVFRAGRSAMSAGAGASGGGNTGDRAKATADAWKAAGAHAESRATAKRSQGG